MASDKRKLYIPHTLTKSKDLQCGICGAGFSKDQMKRYDDHMARCANTDEAQQMEQHSPRVKFPFLRPDFGDVEYENWVKQHARAIAEGRTKM